MGFVDIQVNGFAGVDFHAEPLTEPQIQHVAEKLREHGTEVILPTITTDEPDRMVLRLRTMRELIDRDPGLRRMMPAFHIEGPCISPVEGYRGAHDPKWIVPATRAVLEPLIEAAGGPGRVAIVTLAPEVDAELHTTRWLAEQGIVVAAGHTDASLDVLRDAEAAGLSLFTHLGNGCAATVDRHDNVINRALRLERIRYSIIPDGVHVPFFVVHNWLKTVGIDRCLFTTDCMHGAACPPGWFERRDGTGLEIGEDRVVRLPGTPYLAGAAITMADGYRNAIEGMGLSEAEARKLTVDLPAKLIGDRSVSA